MIKEVISIHALPKEGDRGIGECYTTKKGISIHSLPKEGDVIQTYIFAVYTIFQSTPSPRRETWECEYIEYRNGISIHSLPKEGDQSYNNSTFRYSISIHSLPKEGDLLIGFIIPLTAYFNPLPPQGGRLKATNINDISIIFQSTPSPRRETEDLSDPFFL